MSRTGKDIPCRVHIAIMDITAITAYPLPYSKVCDTVRPRVGKASTTRADLGRKALIDFLIPRAMLNSLVREHRTEARPRGIEKGLGHPGPGQSCGVDISNRDVIKLTHDAVRELMQEIPARVRDPAVDLRGEPFLMCALSLSKALFKPTIPTGILDLLARREGGKFLQPKINADAALKCSDWRVGKLHYNVEEPVTAPITAEVRSVLDLAIGERTGIEHTEGAACKAECLALTFEVTAFERYPCKRLFSAIAQVRPPVLTSGLGILLAHGINGARVQSEFLGTSGSQDVEVEPTRPALVPFERVLLGIVAVVPNVVDRAALLIQQTTQRLHSIAAGYNHCISIQVNWMNIQDQRTCSGSSAGVSGLQDR